MIQRIPDSYSFLQYPKQDIDKITSNPGEYYTSLSKAKKKHGAYQFKDNILR